MLMRIKIIMLLIVVLLILIKFKIYAPEVDYTIEEEADSLIDETPDEEEAEVVFTYSPLSEDVKEIIIGSSYKENDEVKIEDLVYAQITHWGFDDEEHKGEIIINKKLAHDVLEIFRELYEAKFPIERVRIIDEYDASDELSMLDNNTSAFCYREIAGGGKLSNHSYGIAIDINPVQNPYLTDDIVLPVSGETYLDRSNVRKGMIVEGDPCYNAFKKRGWTWGGDWNSLKDYQHFEFKLNE